MPLPIKHDARRLHIRGCMAHARAYIICYVATWRWVLPWSVGDGAGANSGGGVWDTMKSQGIFAGCKCAMLCCATLSAPYYAVLQCGELVLATSSDGGVLARPLVVLRRPPGSVSSHRL